MLIALDIDGCITDYETVTNKIVKEYLKDNNINYSHDSSGYSLTKRFNISEEAEVTCWKYLFASNVNMNKPREGVASCIKALQQDGHKVIIITARDCKREGASTEEFLASIGVPKLDMYYTIEKTELCNALGVDLIVDDAPHNLKSFFYNDVPYLIFCNNYNKHIVGPRVSTWEGVYEYISTRDNYRDYYGL